MHPHLAGAAVRLPYTSDTLPNGLILLVHEDHSTPIVTVSTLRRVGSADEKAGRTGFAHLYEHLMFMGSEHAPYPMFDRLLEAAGAEKQRVAPHALARGRSHRLGALYHGLGQGGPAA